MSLWPAYLIVGLVLLAAIAVLLASAWIAGRSPGFWWGLGRLALAELLPGLSVLFRRAPPAVEAERRHEAVTGVKRPTTGVTTTKPAATRGRR